jgi:hypothetical protein
VRCTKEIGAALLLASWDELSESCISVGWDFGESPEENEQESDDSDDDFELQMASDSEDEDSTLPAHGKAIESVV